MLNARAFAASRNILGTSVAAVTGETVVAAVEERVADDAFAILSFLNANNANIAQRDADLRAALDRSLVLPDGIGVDLASRLLYGASFPENLNGTDFVPFLFGRVTRPLRIGLVGGNRVTAEKARDAFAQHAPQHDFTLFADGYEGRRDLDGLLKALEVERPDILIVALGTPLQEVWIDRHIGPEHCKVAISVGALFDFMGGAVARAPLWMRRLRIEWVYRLLIEPKRMWRRYLVGNPLFMMRVFKQMLRGRAGDPPMPTPSGSLT